MNIFKKLVIFLLIMLLSACASTPEKDAEKIEQAVIPDAATQGLSELETLDGR